LNGSLGFCGEESAGASFLARDGSPWSTDKDGIIAALLAAEITGRAGRDPGELYAQLTEQHGAPAYERIDAPANALERAALARLSPTDVPAHELAGEPILQILNTAPGDGNPIEGIKVVAPNGWFAARPSGTEDVYKIYAESFHGDEHLRRIQDEARAIVARALAKV
jgi:phosphoglucomutase